MFVGRERELAQLNKLYASNRFEFAVIYGRRRVGKSTLIKEFCKNKTAIYYIAIESGSENNLRAISKSVFSYTMPGLVSIPAFEDFEKMFDYIYEIAKEERIILVIDEYPYLAGAERSISSLLQKVIDEKFKDSKLFLILCGSSMSFMEHQVLGYQSPLYGRRTAQFKIRSFDFFEARKFYQNFSLVDEAVIYGVVGGIPYYLNVIDDQKSVKQNIIDAIFNENALLFEEPANLLKQELREPQTYNSIITAVAKGASRLNEIASKAGLETSVCSKYISALIALGLIRKEKPVTEKESKRSIYLLEDNLFRFWYCFLADNMTAVVSDQGEQLFNVEVSPKLANYMGHIFEDICQQYLLRLSAKNALPLMIKDIGRWWGNNPIRRKQQEIDIMAVSDNDAIFAECKWTDKVVSVDIAEDLLAKAEIFNYKRKFFYIFSKTGFSAGLIDFAKEHENFKLVSLEQMIADIEEGRQQNRN